MVDFLTLSAKIEAILFYKGEPLLISDLAKLVAANEQDVRVAIRELEERMRGGGLQLVQNGDEVMLGTTASASVLIEAIQKDELSRDIGKAGLETLAIVLYKGPISRREIDYIRGVNSQFILRNLMIRGLIERSEERPGTDDPKVSKARGYYYRPTTQLVSLLGLGSVEDLPEFQSMKKQMDDFTAAEEKAEQQQKES